MLQSAAKHYLRPSKCFLTASTTFVLTLSLLCCAHHNAQGKEPQWVVIGSGVFEQKGMKIFIGVGNAQRMQNKKFAKNIAKQRALVELSAEVKRFVTTLLSSFTGVCPKTKQGQTAPFSAAVKLLVELATAVAKDTKEWKNPETGELFVAYTLSFQQFLTAIQRSDKISNECKKHFRKKAARSFSSYIKKTYPDKRYDKPRK